MAPNPITSLYCIYIEFRIFVVFVFCINPYFSCFVCLWLITTTIMSLMKLIEIFLCYEPEANKGRAYVTG